MHYAEVETDMMMKIKLKKKKKHYLKSYSTLKLMNDLYISKSDGCWR